jgi:hypothetical protein
MKQTMTIHQAGKAIESIHLLDGTLPGRPAEPARLTFHAKYMLSRNLKLLQAGVDQEAKPFFEFRDTCRIESGKVTDPAQIAELNRLDAEIGRIEKEFDLIPIKLSEIQDTSNVPGMIEALGYLDGIIINDINDT